MLDYFKEKKFFKEKPKAQNHKANDDHIYWHKNVNLVNMHTFYMTRLYKVKTKYLKNV